MLYVVVNSFASKTDTFVQLIDDGYKESWSCAIEKAQIEWRITNVVAWIELCS